MFTSEQTSLHMLNHARITSEQTSLHMLVIWSEITDRVKSGNGITLSLLEDTRVQTNFRPFLSTTVKNPKNKKVAPGNYLNFGIFQNI